ncbi:MAG: HAMP domain-containing histidine kinase, partial [Candidatus Eremiobacteraeota bacterium]|nr:HAMP domain-containing histidine kinase [Candidatus Eremiobacteraeota bacterium]
LVLSYTAGDADIAVERHALSTEIASLVARAADSPEVFRITANDALGRLTLDALGAREALVSSIAGSGRAENVLIESASVGRPFVADALETLRAFSVQAAMALEQARLFTQLGERNEEIAKQKDELADRSDVIRDIVYALAHDLRMPLVAADVTTKQALAGAYGDLPMRYTEVLRATLSANEEERRIVESLLLVARYEAGEESNLREPVALKSLVGGAVEELKPVAESNGVTLQSEVDSDALRTVGDPHEIRRAVLNLIANAITATPQGGTISIRGGTSKSNVTVSVEDDGYGVPEDLRPALFTRFGSARPGGGTGLGLYIVRRIAEKHNGAITYLPREPRGSIFTLILPAE